MQEKDFQTLFASDLFRNCNQAFLQDFFDRNTVTIKVFETGNIICSPFTEIHDIGVVLSGKAVVTTPNPSKKTLLRYLEASDIFGLANLFQKEPFISEIKAKKRCRILFIPSESVERLLDEDKVFRSRFIAYLSNRIRFLNCKIGFLTAGTATERLALYLCSRESDTVTLEESLSALSELLDIGRASLYRAFDKLTEVGLLSKVGNTFHIKNRKSLEAFLKNQRSDCS